MSNFILKTLETRELKLNTIRLRGFYGGKLRKGSGGGGSGDGFPQLPGDVTRWHFGGLTNEMMAAMDDPRIEDADHKGRFLSFKNFAWGGMSGVGGYTENYNSNRWYKVETRIDATWTYKSFNARSIKDNIAAQLFYQSKSSDTGFRVLSCTIKVSGLTDGQGIEYVSNGTQQFVIMRIENDGIYHLPSFDFGAKNAYYGFRFLKLQESCNITIEQLPLYPGALVFDGVDDRGTCDNFPILTKEKGYTVVALRQWITRGERALGLVSNVKNWLKDGAFLLEYRNIQADHLNKPISFGAIGSEMDLPHILTYQTSKSYNGVLIATGNFEGTDVLHVGKLALTNVGTCINAAIWELVFLDHDATEEELTKIKDYFVKTYPWLFPNQAWTVTGKTNEDEDRATIANITGNGNDLVLSNFGFIEGSGYNEEGEYAGYLVTDGVDDSGRAVGLTISKDFTLVGEWILFSKTSVNAGLSIHPQIHIFNRPEVIQIIFRTAGKTLPVKSLKAICSDGRCYDENWSELKINVGEFTDNKGTLFVASNGTNYAQIAFKNLGIYNDQLLSKDDCIKAYNYLQTLKAK